MAERDWGGISALSLSRIGLSARVFGDGTCAGLRGATSSQQANCEEGVILLVKSKIGSCFVR